MPSVKFVVDETKRLKDKNLLLPVEVAPINPRLGGAPKKKEQEAGKRKRDYLERMYGKDKEAAKAAATAVTDEAMKPKTKQQRPCGYCGVPGHRQYWRKDVGPVTCPKKKQDLAENKVAAQMPVFMDM